MLQDDKKIQRAAAADMSAAQLKMLRALQKKLRGVVREVCYIHLEVRGCETL